MGQVVFDLYDFALMPRPRVFESKRRTHVASRRLDYVCEVVFPVEKFSVPTLSSQVVILVQHPENIMFRSVCLMEHFKETSIESPYRGDWYVESIGCVLHNSIWSIPNFRLLTILNSEFGPKP
jgi:hypothetical protein